MAFAKQLRLGQWDGPEGDNYFTTRAAYIEIPDGIILIEDIAFSGCSSLKSIDIPNSVTTIGFGVFSGCSALQSIDVSEDNQNYTSIDGVLYDKELKTIIKFPEDNDATEYIIPNSVTNIGDRAFFNCRELTSITIPNSVTTIGDGAFSGCSSLQSIHTSIIEIEKANINNYAFYGIDTDNCVLYIPPGTRWAYRHHPVFGKFKNIEIEKQD